MFLTDLQAQELYAWIDEIPLSRPKRNINRDFADGVLAAEIVRYFFPRLVELHNYPPANSHTQKLYNWKTLNQKVLKRVGIKLSDELCTDVASGKTGAIEEILLQLREAVQQGVEPRRSSADTTRSMPAYIGASPTMQTMPQYQMYPQQQQFVQMNQAGGYLPPLSPTQHMMTMQQPMFQAPSPAQHMMMPPMFPTMQQQQIPNQQLQDPGRYGNGNGTVPRQKKKSVQPESLSTVVKPTPIRQSQQKHVTIQHRSSDGDVQAPPVQQSPRQPKKSVSASAGQRPSIDVEAEIRSLYEDKIKNQTGTITSLNETVDILQLKIQKLEQLLQLKDKKLAEISGSNSRASSTE